MEGTRGIFPCRISVAHGAPSGAPSTINYDVLILDGPLKGATLTGVVPKPRVSRTVDIKAADVDTDCWVCVRRTGATANGGLEAYLILVEEVIWDDCP